MINIDEREEAKVWLVIDATNQAIKESGKQGIPEGHLYAMVMDIMSLETFNSIINLLVEAGKVIRVGHLLTATMN